MYKESVLEVTRMTYKYYMDIKTIQPHRSRSKKSPFKQGYYEPLFPEKYCGRMPIIYRSSWEYRVCKFLDESSSVIRWGSECIRIPYFSILDEKNHEYFPDFYFEYRVGDTIRKIIVEVKPKKDLTPPEKPKKETPKALFNYQRAGQVYIKNMEKAKACKAYCNLHGMEYKFVTEDSHLNF